MSSVCPLGVDSIYKEWKCLVGTSIQYGSFCVAKNVASSATRRDLDMTFHECIVAGGFGSIMMQLKKECQLWSHIHVNTVLLTSYNCSCVWDKGVIYLSHTKHKPIAHIPFYFRVSLLVSNTPLAHFLMFISKLGIGGIIFSILCFMDTCGSSGGLGMYLVHAILPVS